MEDEKRMKREVKQNIGKEWRAMSRMIGKNGIKILQYTFLCILSDNTLYLRTEYRLYLSQHCSHETYVGMSVLIEPCMFHDKKRRTTIAQITHADCVG
jgi:hypothetical protein